MKVLIATLTVLLLPALAVAEPACEPTTTPATVCWAPAPCVPTEVAGAYYVSYDHCGASWCIYSIWVYQESNGIPGLQRQDEVRDDTCGGRVQGDTIVF